jgi:hypothetical protein
MLAPELGEEGLAAGGHGSRSRREEGHRQWGGGAPLGPGSLGLEREPGNGDGVQQHAEAGCQGVAERCRREG